MLQLIKISFYVLNDCINTGALDLRQADFFPLITPGNKAIIAMPASCRAVVHVRISLTLLKVDNSTPVCTQM